MYNSNYSPDANTSQNLDDKTIFITEVIYDEYGTHIKTVRIEYAINGKTYSTIRTREQIVNTIRYTDSIVYTLGIDAQGRRQTAEVKLYLLDNEWFLKTTPNHSLADNLEHLPAVTMR